MGAVTEDIVKGSKLSLWKNELKRNAEENPNWSDKLNKASVKGLTNRMDHVGKHSVWAGRQN